MAEDGRVLTVSELANRLRIGRSTAYGLCSTPGFPAVRLGRVIRIPEVDLEAWMQQMVIATPDREKIAA